MIHLVTLLEILAAIFMFGIIIFVHEFGHFIVAKWMKIKVNEFSLGMGPLLFQFGKKETKYSLRAIPLGGYCAMEGEDENSEDPNAFVNKAVWRRILVVIAGVFMNFLLGFFVLLLAVGCCTQPLEGQDKVYFCSTKISEISEASPAYAAGLSKDDTIVSINGKRVVSDIDMIYLLQSDKDGVFDMDVKRQVGADPFLKTIHLEKVPFTIQETEDGSRYLEYNFKVYPIEKSFFTVCSRSLRLEYSYSVLIIRSFGSLISGEYGINDLSGPVGATDVIKDAVDDAVDDVVNQHRLDGLYALLMLFVLITVNVGIFNILPLPALDGGRLLFLLIELVIGKRVPQKYEAMVHTVGFLLLILFSIFITYNDIVKLFQK